MGISVELNTKVIDKRQNIWVIFPGKFRRYIDRFMIEKMIFLGIPGTLFDERVNNMSMSDYKNDEIKDYVRKNVVRSIAMRQWLNSTEGQFSPQGRPSDDLDRFPLRPSPDVKSYPSTVATVGRFFVGMKKGDLVLVPGKGGAFSEVHFGEISSDFNPEDKIYLSNFRDEPIQIRKVKWLSNTVNRSNFSLSIYKQLSKPPAVQQITDMTDRMEIYSAAYKNFIVGDKSRALIFSDRYDGKDPTSVNEINDVVKFLVAAYACIERNELSKLQNIEDIKKFSEENFDSDLLDNYTLDFHSPGQFGVYPSKVGLSVFLSTALAISSSVGLSACHGETVKIENRLAEEAADGDDFYENIDILMKTMNPEAKAQLDEKTTDAKAEIGVETPLTVRQE